MKIPNEIPIKPPLTDEMVAKYHDDGFLTPIRLFDDDELIEIRACLDGMIAGLPPGVAPDSQAAFDVFNMPHPKSRFLMEFLSQPRVLNLAEQIIGPNIGLFASHFLSKTASTGKATPWHQDGAYWHINPMKVVTIWLAIDRSDEENGCMRVVPGTHKSGPLGHGDVENPEEHMLWLKTNAEEMDGSLAVDLVLDPGEVSLHDAMLVHGSNRNSSNRRRCGFTMRYIPVDKARYDRDKWPDQPLYLLNGEDTASNNTYGAKWPK